jgi:dTDP-4-amino-4,6-dideoxygalactose transaminase
MDNIEKKIRFNDVRAAYLEQQSEIDAAIAAVIARGDFINGEAVARFEKDFATYCGASYCVGTSNGTSALHLALVAAGIGPGDEVITTAMTFIATSEAITQAGAKVVFCDVDPDTLNLDSRKLDRAISPASRAVLFVHLHGNPGGLLETAEFCRANNLLLIEDCAQAHGARFQVGGRDVHAGNVGVAGTFSFFPGKNLGAFGDAGAVITGDQALALKTRKLANHGRSEKYMHEIEGYNYRLDTLQAAILDVKLGKLDAQVDARNRLAEMYESQLNGCGDINLQKCMPHARHARHLFVIQTGRRDELQKHLRDSGIETGIHYPIPLHLQPAYAALGYHPGDFPVAERLAQTGLSLPMYPQLPKHDVEFVCEKIRKFFR